jgi:hypothetical protein
MDQFVDKHYMTREFLETQLVQNKERITQLEESHSKLAQRSYADSADKNRMVESMQEWALNELENGQITESQAEEIAEIMGFDLVKEVEVEVTVTYNFTVNVGPNEDAESIINDIDFDTIQYNDDNISYMSSSVDRIDF